MLHIAFGRKRFSNYSNDHVITFFLNHLLSICHPNRCISMETLTFPELDFLDFIDTTIQGKIVYGSSRKTAYSHTKV